MERFPVDELFIVKRYYSEEEEPVMENPVLAPLLIDGLCQYLR